MASPAVVSSSSTLWATPSKEWTVPPKPKPGRKPKKDPANTADEVDANGRRVQNRAAQRAFRERKQSQLAELQAKLKSYEQGDSEKSVALQGIARRLKDENQALRAENASLKGKLTALSHQLEMGHKRWRGDDPPEPVKKQKLESSTFRLSMPFASPSPSSGVSSSESDEPPFSPIQLEPSPPDPSQPTLSSLIQLSAHNKSAYEVPDIFANFGCGLCTADTPCLCRQALSQATESPGLKFEAYSSTNVITIEPSPPSILDNLPEYQPAIPLRRRPTSARTVPVFSTVGGACSGDPKNCEACANDSFGQAFCEAINRSVSAHGSCTNCLCSDSATQQTGAPVDTESIPTNDAWQQLKSHPGVSFADLALLADVVARRSKCTGPRVTLSPTPEPSSLEDGPDSRSVILTDPHAHYHERHRSSPKLVPQDELVRCGQERVRQVQAAGVRDALRLLDTRLV